MKKKNGMTLVEVVVAMSVVILISFAALSTVLFGAESFENQQYRQYAVNEADNVIACLQSDNPSEALRFVYGIDVSFSSLPEGTSCFVLYFPGDRYTMKDNGERSSDEVTVNFVGLVSSKDYDNDGGEAPANCAIRVLVYLKKSSSGTVQLNDLVADAVYFSSGNRKLSRAYRFTLDSLDLWTEAAVSPGTEASS